MDLCRIIDARSEDPFAYLRTRQIGRDHELEGIVAGIIDTVRQRGDEALLESARAFDAPGLQSILVSDGEFETAELPARRRAALEHAAQRIDRFHRRQMEHLTCGMRSEPGALGWSNEGVGQRILPLQSTGIYVPGGKAAYPSSVLMTGIPARVAGVRHRFMTTPARRDGSLEPAVLAAMHMAGIERVFKIGGAAAIAALALGTESVPRVDKIVGPGNRYVNEAKRQMWGRVGLDGFAGPSEVCVLVDETANPEYAAADLLTQIEHSDDNAAFLVSTDVAMLHRVLDTVEAQLRGSQQEASMRKALSDESSAFVARDMSQALEIVNAIAPEHVTVSTRNPERVAEGVQNAGCVLLGDFTPESAGDFVLGPSHTLPTRGAARFAGPLNVLDFLKIQTVCNLSREQLEPLVATIEAFGEMEGFPAHARGATIRFRD